jgi:hypothetical protein
MRLELARKIASITGAPNRRIEKQVNEISQQEFEELLTTFNAGPLGAYSALTKLLDWQFNASRDTTTNLRAEDI